LAGSKPLTALAKKFPFFNKKDEIFTTLADMNIPSCRALWFIKMTNAYYNAQQESGKIKKKQVTDAGNGKG
jgi:mediator of RNA polymerase II transcription subunit 12